MLATQGHEIHYATNHLGHFCLTQLLLDLLLPAKARVVVVNSVLHTIIGDVSPDYKYSSLPIIGSIGGWIAYCRRYAQMMMMMQFLLLKFTSGANVVYY